MAPAAHFYRPGKTTFLNRHFYDIFTAPLTIYTVARHLLTGNRYSMQNRLEKVVTEHADKLYLDISRAKDEIFPKFPSIKEDIMKIQNGP